MARTHRTHLAPAEHAKRGGSCEEKKQRKLLKSHKQLRPNERAKLRKDYL